MAAFIGCGDDGGTPAIDVSAPPIDSGGGAATVEATANPETVAAGAVTVVTVTVTNFTLVDPAAMPPNMAGEGHYHIYLDNETGGNYLNVGFDGTEDVTIPVGTTAGAHTLRVALHNNDHTAVTPAVEDVVNITVQ
jgi:hypothetical protein